MWQIWIFQYTYIYHTIVIRKHMQNVYHLSMKWNPHIVFSRSSMCVFFAATKFEMTTALYEPITKKKDNKSIVVHSMSLRTQRDSHSYVEALVVYSSKAWIDSSVFKKEQHNREDDLQWNMGRSQWTNAHTRSYTKKHNYFKIRFELELIKKNYLLGIWLTCTSI